MKKKTIETAGYFFENLRFLLKTNWKIRFRIRGVCAGEKYISLLLIEKKNHRGHGHSILVLEKFLMHIPPLFTADTRYKSPTDDHHNMHVHCIGDKSWQHAKK